LVNWPAGDACVLERPVYWPTYIPLLPGRPVYRPMQKYLVPKTVINMQGRPGIYSQMAREVRVQRANDQDKEK